MQLTCNWAHRVKFWLRTRYQFGLNSESNLHSVREFRPTLWSTLTLPTLLQLLWYRSRQTNSTYHVIWPVVEQSSSRASSTASVSVSPSNEGSLVCICVRVVERTAILWVLSMKSWLFFRFSSIVSFIPLTIDPMPDVYLTTDTSYQRTARK